MDQRKYNIFNALYQAPQSKDNLAKLEGGVSTKTIENTINKYNIEDNANILYDKSISAYRFNTLLPSRITVSSFMNIFQDSISNNVLRNDFIQVCSNSSSFFPSYETSKLSTMAQKVIMLNLAIKYNCIIKFEYIGNDKQSETKHVKPHKVHTNGFTYYLYGTYSKNNEKDVGSARSFAINGMYDLEAEEYTHENLIITDDCSAYGIINKEKYVTLLFHPVSANFFKREGIFSQKKYEFVTEEIDGSVVAKMYYNHQQEIIKLMQEWMPHIKLHSQNESAIIESIHAEIQKNFQKLFNNVPI